MRKAYTDFDFKEAYMKSYKWQNGAAQILYLIYVLFHWGVILHKGLFFPLTIYFLCTSQHMYLYINFYWGIEDKKILVDGGS